MSSKWWDNIFADPAEGLVDAEELNGQEEIELMDKIAHQVVKRELTVPAIMFLESVKPLNFIGSQAMVFFNPLVQIVFPSKIYGQMQLFFEKRENVEKLIQHIEKADSEYVDQNKKLNSDKPKPDKTKKKTFFWWKRRSDEAKGTDQEHSGH
ncbi:MAG: hypothetical protein APR63_01430 [Desulfuromonas sp. SDB]|nr:MAG: hypothetical protein APR63_01430 [Desulfuromonas sp. SDB]